MAPAGRRRERFQIPQRVGAPAEVNYGGLPGPDYGPLVRDRIPIRSIEKRDLRTLVDIDRQISGIDRSDYFARKLEEAIHESDVRMSLVAEIDSVVVGFLMARVDFGEFGLIEPTAVLDTLGVHVEYRNRGVGRALMSQLLVNLMTLRVQHLRTDIAWHDHELLAFFDRCGFGPSQRLCLTYPIGA
jgi:predicted N-acetyltransferase YhbS